MTRHQQALTYAGWAVVTLLATVALYIGVGRWGDYWRRKRLETLARHGVRSVEELRAKIIADEAVSETNEPPRVITFAESTARMADLLNILRDAAGEGDAAMADKARRVALDYFVACVHGAARDAVKESGV